MNPCASGVSCVQEVAQGSRVVRAFQGEELGTMSVVAIALSCAILFCCACVGLVAWMGRHAKDAVRCSCFFCLGSSIQ